MNSYKLYLYMYWYPQALLTAEQACRRRVFILCKSDEPFSKHVRFLQTSLFLWSFSIFTYL